MTGPISAPNPIPLSSTTLAALPGGVRVPTYDRTKVRAGIVHIGVGGFHRAHLATYVDELCSLGHTSWGISGCGVMAGDSRMAEALDPQDCLYTLITRGATTTTVEVIGAIVEFIHAVPDPAAVIARIADPNTQIVSMTVTEGGYPVDDLSCGYLPDSPNTGPASAFGIIAAGLDRRRQDHGNPITIMSCDNVMGNGAVARAATLGEAARHGADLVGWIESSASFPNSMVDRITPATSPSDLGWLQDSLGLHDRWPVVTEPFRQWVVQDAFAGARPPLELLDVIVADDIEPYEFMKLRLLNAGHSAMAYLAAIMGIDSVDAAMAEPLIADFLGRFLFDEAKPVLPPVDIDVDDYINTLLQRFENPQIGDQISRLCLDGSAKFPKFLLPTLRGQLRAGGPVKLGALALAGWCQYLLGTDDAGSAIDVAADPRRSEATEFARASQSDPAAFLGFDAVFDPEIAGAGPFRSAFVAALSSLRTNGARATLASTLVSDHVHNTE